MEGAITEGNIGRATRTTAVMAIFAAVLMLGIPSFDHSAWNNDLAPVGQVAAAGNPGNRILTIGQVNFATSIQTLNPLAFTMGVEFEVFYPCYSTLLTRDIDGATLVGDLARSWSVSPNGLFWNITLTPNAKFYDKYLDPVNFHSVTSSDVAYSFNLSKNEPISYYHSYFPDLNGQNVMKTINTPSPYEVRIELSTTYAPFSSALLNIPIFPEYIWTGERWNWDNYDIGSKAAIVGSGPFFYNLSGLPQAGLIELDKNPYWHGTAESGWEVRVDKVYVRSETSDDANLNDFKTGLNDIILYTSASQYLNVLSKPEYSDVLRFDVAAGFVYEFNMNQMTDARRESLGPAYAKGYNNQLLLDPVVKKAMAKCIDKQEFINQVRGGLGLVADSLVPYNNPWHYTYGSNPERDTLDLSTDRAAARQMLRDAGWTYNLAGQYVPPTDTTTYPLCKVGGSDPLRFRFYTLDTNPEWEAAARLIAGWCQQAGVDLWTLMDIRSVNLLNGDWKTANYDMWIWDWIFSPSSDISTDVMTVLTSWDFASTDVFWADATFDALYNKSLVTMDPEERRIYGDEMQRLAYENMGCEPVAYRSDLHAASSRGQEQWCNYGNWKTNWVLTPDAGYYWFWFMIQPKGQLAPKISGLSVPAIGYVGTPVDMSATVTDTNTLQGRWFYDSEGNSSAYADVSGGVSLGSHTYTRDGEYTVYFAVKEKDGLDHFANWTKTNIKIYDMTNDAPTGVEFTWSPPSNINAGTIVTFTGTGSDPESDPLYYNWNFGDGGTSQGKVVQHQFREGAPSTVTVSVTDNRLGTGDRPQTAVHLISVGANEKPSVSVDDPGQVPPNQLYPLNVTASDPESDALEFTWLWGDGTSPTVTSVPTAEHRYRNQGLYTLTVYCDDQTGLFGHNRSDSRVIAVRRGSNAAPTMDSWGIGPTRNPVRFQNLNFYANATDSDNDALEFSFTFESGVTQKIVVDTNSKTENAVLVHKYPATGLKIASVTVTDFVNVTAGSPSTLPVTVALGDHEPVIAPLSNFKDTVGHTRSFSASATDSDGDTLTYWWDFGDYMGAASGSSTSYKYLYGSGLGGFLYRVWVNDNNISNPAGPMNVSAYAYAYINEVPYISFNETTRGTFLGGQSLAMHVNASDNDTLDISSLNYTWDFGDGTIVNVVGMTGKDVTHVYPNLPYNKTYKVQVWVKDTWVDSSGVSHNVTKFWYVSIAPNPGLPLVPFSVTLTKGWNFVTVPSVGGGYKAGNLPGLMTGDSISQWDPGTQTYNKTFIKGITPPTGDFAILPSAGYWINVGATRWMNLTLGWIPTGVPQTRAITLPAATGWVNLAFNTLNGTWKASNIVTMYSPGAVQSVSWYNPVTKAYKTYIAGVPPSDFTLTPGQAIWVSVSGGGTVSYTP